MNRLSPTAAAIDAAKAQGRAALIAYLPVGYPSLAGTIEAAQLLLEVGVDVLELGLPYSDPVMDGPVIEHAVTASLAAGFTVDQLFQVVEELSGMGQPLLVMTYFNPVFRRGVARFAHDLAAAGGAGLITPDLIPDEAGVWLEESDKHGLDRVFLVAPSSSDQRLAKTAAACRGFTYATSTMGVTGQRDQLSQAAEVLVTRSRAAGAERVCVGIGVSSATQARQVAGFADGVIVGSALVDRLGANHPPGAFEKLAIELVEAVHR